jgi:DNA primase
MAEQQRKTVTILDYLETVIEDSSWRDGTSELWGRCPHPEHLAVAKKNDPDHWSVNLAAGLHNCYACGYSGTLIPLLQDLGLSRFEALRLASGPRPKRIAKRKVKVVLRESDLLPFRYLHPYWEARGIKEETIRAFKLGYKESLPEDPDELKAFRQRVIIPVRDGRGALLGFCGRSIDDGRNPKYLYSKGLDTRRYVFCFDKVGRGPVFLVEGMIDALRLWQLGFQAVTCFGSEMFEEQAKKLSLVDKLYMIPDNDAKGKKFVREVRKKLPTIRDIIYLPSGYKDPGEMEDDDLRMVLEHYRE